MRNVSYLVLGGSGFIGSAVVRRLQAQNEDVLAVSRGNYEESRGIHAGTLVNCNGNTFRYRANSDPRWDFEASVTSVRRSLVDFPADRYIYLSTVDVYHDRSNPQNNREECIIQTRELDTYGFHKWIAERLVETLSATSVILRLASVVGEALKKGPLFDLLQGDALHMSPESELTFIDSGTIADAVLWAARQNCEREIFNLAGAGSVRLSELGPLLAHPIRTVPGAEKIVYRYNIANQKLHALFPLPASKEVAERFLRTAGTRDLL